MQNRILHPTALALACLWCCAAQAQNKGVVAAQEEQLDAQAQQYVQMMQPLMWRELEFIRQTCDLKPDQRPKIKSAGDAGLKQAARDMVRPRLGGARTPATAGDTIRTEIGKALKAALTVEQLAAYEAEEARRRAADKQAAITSAVATIDGALFLNQEQRDKIVKELDTHWRADWEQWLQMWQYAGQYYPQIPDPHVTPHLTAEQKTVWRGLQKVSFSSWGGEFQRPAGDDDWWSGKPPAGKAKAKGKAKAADAAP